MNYSFSAHSSDDAAGAAGSGVIGAGKGITGAGKGITGAGITGAAGAAAAEDCQQQHEDCLGTYNQSYCETAYKKCMQKQ